MNDPRQGIASSVPPLQPTVRHAFVVQVAPGSPIAKQCVGVGAAIPLKHHCPPAYARRAARGAAGKYFKWNQGEPHLTGHSTEQQKYTSKIFEGADAGAQQMEDLAWTCTGGCTCQVMVIKC